MLYEEQNIQWEHYINVLKLLQANFEVNAILFKNLNVNKKKLIISYTFFVNSFITELLII